jgi:hypothetical protein
MTTHNEEPTLKDIEKHLNRQDKEVKKSTYGSYGAFGASIILVGISLWVGSRILSADTLFWEYIFLIAIGFGVMFWSWHKQRILKDSSNSHCCEEVESDNIINVTEQESPSIDIVLDEARRTLDSQFEQLDALDTKSGILLGIAGVVITILVSASIGRLTLMDSLIVKIVVSIIAVTLFISLVLSYYNLRIGKWHKPPELDVLVNDYVSKNAHITKCKLIGTIQKAMRDNEKLIERRFFLYERSYNILFAGLALVTVSVIALIFI